MRWLLLLLVACDAEPHISCTTDSQCLSGQSCVAGTCAAPRSQMPDGPGSSMMVDAATDASMPIDGPLPTCMPACNGATPYCVGQTCVQCVMSSQCPVATPCCVANTCQLLGC